MAVLRFLYMKRWLISVLALVLMTAGCSWSLPFFHRFAKPPVLDDGISFQVLDPSAFRKVHKICFEEFSAGEDAQAGDALDRLALMIIKGFSDVLQERGHLTLLPGDRAAEADAVVKGSIEGVKVRGWFFRKKIFIKLRADVRSMMRDEVLALVYVSREFRKKGRNSDQAAYDIGHAMAEKFYKEF